MVDNSKRLSYGGSFDREEGSGYDSLGAAIAQGVQSAVERPDAGRFVIIASDYNTGSVGARPGPIVTIERVDGRVVATFASDLAGAVDAAIYDVRFGPAK